jgi:hypothetical protein
MRHVGSSCFRWACAGFVVASFALAAGPALAQSNPFGAEGQVVPFGDVGVELELAGGAPGTGGALGHNFSLQISPSVLYFVARNFAVGFGLTFRYGDYALQQWPYEDLEFGADVGAGVHLPINETAGFFPRI